MFLSLGLGYAFLLWFGMYLLQRGIRNKSMASAGAGLLVHAFGLGAAVLMPFAGTERTGAVPLTLQAAAAGSPLIGFAILIRKNRGGEAGRSRLSGSGRAVHRLRRLYAGAASLQNKTSRPNCRPAC